MTHEELLVELMTFSPGFTPNDRSWLKAFDRDWLATEVASCRKAVAEGKEIH
jgi:hypothetical protein